MAKQKKGLSDKVRKSKQQKKSSNTLDKVRKNPFEIKINKQKHNILGRKTKNDRGLPGVSRSKANKKRKDTLLNEYKHRNKTNQIRDARFGLNDEQMTIEEKMLQRFSMERKKKHEKMAQFNLNDDEELTHLGQSLSAIKQFDDFDGSDEEDGPGGTMSGEYVENAHFGGGFFTKKSSEGNDNELTKTRKEVIDDIIAKSKLAKFEKKAAREKSDELREKLDDAWSDFQKLIQPSVRTSQDKNTAKERSKPDEYDMAVKQMLFDRKAAPSEKMKSEAELEEERAALLWKQEEERIARMRMDGGNEDASRKRTHQSADALEEDYVVEKVNQAEPLSFNFDDEDEKSEDYVGENEEEEEDAPEDQVESELGDLGIVDDGGDSDDENDEDQSDEFSDIDSGNEEDVSSLEEQPDVVEDVVNKAEEEEDVGEMLNKFPASYSEFSFLISSSALSASEVVSDLRKRFAPSIGKGNKAKMIELFAYIWQHCCMVAAPKPDFNIINSLISHAYELCALNPENCSECVKERLKRSYLSCVQASRIQLPSFEILIQFKLIKLLYSTSDFCHPVVTPALLFISHLLDCCSVHTLRDVSKGLYLCTVAYEYVSFSKRYIPECLNFLTTVLCMAVPDKQNKADIPTITSTRINGKNFDILVVKKKNKFKENQLKPDLSVMMDENNDINDTALVRCQLVATATRLTALFSTLYSEVPAYDEVFTKIHSVCDKLKTSFDRSNLVLAKLVDGVLKSIESNCQKPRTPISFGQRKPKPLRMFDLKIDDTGDPLRKKSKQTNALKRERDRLLHKRKREMKGAIREVRKDSKFIARHQQKEQEAMDAEREAKVKRLYGLLSNQEGEVKNIQRKKYKLDI
uniref:nucleolar protein 14-like n=1 Tax=Ciona intestinalis TaxID=7719 RepID=UPI000180C501|nr:nucleolar protein 14-like [Ciona intestinalis]|eukprot:XP_002128116.1 nucleolar protein 14-like [Ciona intestinalis]